MRILPIHVIPIFLNRGFITGQVGAQVRSFDVYYKMPPAVGFHVIGCEADTGVLGFNVEAEESEDTVQGFNVVTDNNSENVAGFIVTAD